MLQPPFSTQWVQSGHLTSPQANHDEQGADEEEEVAPKKGKGKKAQSSTTAEPKASKPRKPRSSPPKAKDEGTASKKSQKGKKPARSAVRTLSSPWLETNVNDFLLLL